MRSKGFLDPVKSVKSMSNELFRFEATGFFTMPISRSILRLPPGQRPPVTVLCAQNPKPDSLGVYGGAEALFCRALQDWQPYRYISTRASVIEDGRFTAGYDDLFYLLPTGKLHDLFDDRAVLVINSCCCTVLHCKLTGDRTVTDCIFPPRRCRTQAGNAFIRPTGPIPITHTRSPNFTSASSTP